MFFPPPLNPFPPGEGKIYFLRVHRKKEQSEAEPVLACGCPSSAIQMLSSPGSGRSSFSDQNDESVLAHWPVQIKLVPAKAPFLKGADLLVLADCVPVSFPTLYRDFLKGKAVMMGCPKLDDAEEYINKFAQVFKEAGIKSVTIVIMEVPCCSGLSMIVKEGMERSGVKVPMEKIVISTKGKIINRTKE